MQSREGIHTQARARARTHTHTNRTPNKVFFCHLHARTRTHAHKTNSPVGFLFFLRLLPQRHCSICDPLLKMLFQINRMDLAETGGEEEEEEGVEEEEVGDERRSGCGSLKFTHRMGADTPPCLHASRAGQLLGSVRRCLAAPTCTIDKNKSRKPGSSPAFSPGSPTSSETTNPTYSASTSSPCGRKRATAAALVSSVPASGCPSCRRSSAEERSLLLPGRRGVESPRALLFKWRRLPRGAGRGAAATDRHAAALA